MRETGTVLVNDPSRLSKMTGENRNVFRLYYKWELTDDEMMALVLKPQLRIKKTITIRNVPMKTPLVL